MCDHRYLDDPTGLRCTSDGEHPNHGHTYAATAGPDLDNAAPTTPKRHATGDDQ